MLLLIYDNLLCISLVCDYFYENRYFSNLFLIRKGTTYMFGRLVKMCEYCGYAL